MQKAFKERIEPLLLKFDFELQKEAEIEFRTNALILGSLSQRLKQLHEATLTQLTGEFASLSLEVQQLFNRELSRGIATKFVNKVNLTDKINTTQAISRAGGAQARAKIKAIQALQDTGIQSIVKSSVDRNVNLIQSIPQQYLQRIKETVYDGLEKGTGTKAIGKQISDIGGVTERRGQFIARDQLASTYGDLTKKRQQNLGIKRFRWLTSHDERVRDTHAALDGMIFDWDVGASGPGVPSEMIGLKPGEDYNCRCTSSMIKEDILEALDRLSDN